MLKTSGSTETIIQSKKGRIGISSDGRAKRDNRCQLNNNKIGSIEFDSGEVKNDEIGKKQKMSKSKKLSKSKKTVESLDFFTLEARIVFTKLR